MASGTCSASHPVRESEFWSIEFSTTTAVPEWGGQKVRMAREEDAYIDAAGQAQYLAGPQLELWLIRSDISPSASTSHIAR